MYRWVSLLLDQKHLIATPYSSIHSFLSLYMYTHMHKLQYLPFVPFTICSNNDITVLLTWKTSSSPQLIKQTTSLWTGFLLVTFFTLCFGCCSINLGGPVLLFALCSSRLGYVGQGTSIIFFCARRLCFRTFFLYFAL